MTYSALLRRDFLALKNFQIIFDKEIRIVQVTEHDEGNYINQSMLIDTSNEKDDLPVLHVNKGLDFKVQKEIENIVSNYLQSDRSDKPAVDFECKVSVKYDQPFSVRPRKLSVEEKRTLQEILDELLKEGIIRESYSPYCSPIVLLKKTNGKDYLY